MIHDEIKKALETDAVGIHVSRGRMWELLREAEAALASLSAPKPSGEVRPNYEHMFMAAVESLAEVSVALGIPDDEASAANGNAEMLARIEELKAAAAPKHKAGDNMEAEAGHVQGSDADECPRCGDKLDYDKFSDAVSIGAFYFDVHLTACPGCGHVNHDRTWVE